MFKEGFVKCIRNFQSNTFQNIDSFIISYSHVSDHVYTTDMDGYYGIIKSTIQRHREFNGINQNENMIIEYD